MINPLTLVSVNSYPSGKSASVQVYTIATDVPLIIAVPFSFSYFGKPVIVAVHSFCSFKVTDCPLLNVTTKLVGLLPSWLLLSSHTFLTVADVTTGVWVFVISNSLLELFFGVIVYA